MNSSREWFYLCLALCGVLLAMLMMFFNYNLKLKDKSLELSQRTLVLEKKNGHEQHQIDELKRQIAELKASIKPANPIPSVPPIPNPIPQSQPNPTTPAPNQQNNLLAELKAKQKAGKLKPSDFKEKP